MIRLFIGIPFFHHNTLITHQLILKKNLVNSKISWISPANFHITLKFLGNTEEYYLNALSQALQQTAQDFSPLELELSAPGFFGPAGKPKVIWYGLNTNKELYSLQQAIEKNLIPLGFDLDEKAFHPHITLGRVKNLTETNWFKSYMEDHSLPKAELFHAHEFHLFKSELYSRRAEYSVITSFRLGNP